MSATPRGTFLDIVETIFRGTGREININDRAYTFREKGNLSEEDPIRMSMYKRMEDRLIADPLSRCSMNLNSANKGQIDNPSYKISFSIAEVLPPARNRKNCHYLIVEGTRYKIDEIGDISKIGKTREEMIELGKYGILQFLERSGEMPDGIELTF